MHGWCTMLTRVPSGRSITGNWIQNVLHSIRAMKDPNTTKRFHWQTCWQLILWMSRSTRLLLLLPHPTCLRLSPCLSHTYFGVNMTGFSPADLKSSNSSKDKGSNVLGDVSKYSFEELEQLGIGKNVSLDWEDSLHTALMPMTPCRSIESVLKPPAAVNDKFQAPVYPVNTSFWMSKCGSRCNSSRQFNKGAAESPNASCNSFYGQVPPPRGSMHGAAIRDPMYVQLW